VLSAFSKACVAAHLSMLLARALKATHDKSKR